MVINNKFDHLKELYLPYKFQLLLRGSRDGFTPKRFHELCDDKHDTITFIKVKGTDEILGGYNPIIWNNSNSWGRTKDSFIFSFKDNDVKNAIISNIRNTSYAVRYYYQFGPYFGYDIIISASRESVNYGDIWCRKRYYEKKIRDTEEQFSMEDYEVHQITRE
ncbi:uncharacterized protein OCT59_025424 [Rhizophagus irregularis]|nr:hypothetical protein OCT59_025424 [Rhizophagus irregularis]